MSALYSIGHAEANRLRARATEDIERAALTRLEAFYGTTDDVRVAADMHARAGNDADAAELLSMLDD